MKISAKEQIKFDEGFSGNVYQCTEGKNTIGYGRNLDNNPLTKKEAEHLLDNDLKRVAKQAMRFSFYKNLDADRRAVVINMIFQLGLKGFEGFKKLIGALDNRDYGRAYTEMLDSKWSQQTPERAQRLAKIMRGF